MSLNYKIRKFDVNFGQISVEYFSEDGLYKQEYAIDLPIKSDNTYPIGNELEEIINGMAPIWHYERIQKVLAGVSNSDSIQSLVEPHPILEPDPIPKPVQQIEEPAEENVPE
jgi:hypothetical protein